jgi:hypothetical protein
MGVSNFKELKDHIGHKFSCVGYECDDQIWNVALECETCNCVIIDFEEEETDERNDGKPLLQEVQ